jgi:iron complex outermembrane receptor protein
VAFRYGRAHRFPTLPEYYWWYGGFDPAAIGVDRPDLTSEKADQYELEVRHTVEGTLSIAVRGYAYEVNDYIRTIFGGSYVPSRVVYNIDRVVLRGLELELGWTVAGGLATSLNYTYQASHTHGDVLDRSDADELTELPEHKVNLGVEYRHRSGLEARLTLRAVSARAEVRGNFSVPGGTSLYDMDAFTDVDLRLRYPLWRQGKDKHLTLELSVENLLNQEIVEQYGFPHPGTTVMAGVRGRL